jgi:hypothetical protein
MATRWLICENASSFGGGFSGGGGGYCLYDADRAKRLKSDPYRCVKHGAILDWAGFRFDGMTRKEVRRLIDADADRA